MDWSAAATYKGSLRSPDFDQNITVLIAGPGSKDNQKDIMVYMRGIPPQKAYVSSGITISIRVENSERN